MVDRGGRHGPRADCVTEKGETQVVAAVRSLGTVNRVVVALGLRPLSFRVVVLTEMEGGFVSVWHSAEWVLTYLTALPSGRCMATLAQRTPRDRAPEDLGFTTEDRLRDK